jgi:acyl carrier protein
MGNVESLLRTAVLLEIRRIATGELGCRREVLLTDRLDADLELDSLELITLVVAVEDRFSIALSGNLEQARTCTVGELVDAVVERLLPRAAALRESP